jgi:hypothetical protein
MKTHEEFVAELMAAAQDVSLPIFQDLLRKGYTDTKWQTNAGATDVECISKDLDALPLKDFLYGLAHNAPIYEKTHIGCRCSVLVTGAGKPDVIVTAFGIEK